MAVKGRNVNPLSRRAAEFPSAIGQMPMLLADNAILVLPSAPGAAPIKALNHDETVRYRNRALGILCIAGLGYLPQLSIPAAVSDGAPLGISLVGAPASDRMLLAVASRLGART